MRGFRWRGEFPQVRVLAAELGHKERTKSLGCSAGKSFWVWEHDLSRKVLDTSQLLEGKLAFEDGQWDVALKLLQPWALADVRLGPWDCATRPRPLSMGSWKLSVPSWWLCSSFHSGFSPSHLSTACAQSLFPGTWLGPGTRCQQTVTLSVGSESPRT